MDAVQSFLSVLGGFCWGIRSPSGGVGARTFFSEDALRLKAVRDDRQESLNALFLSPSLAPF
jgi:hypothetical protein